MKNILIIGNGFDLAHGLPTSYSDFLDFLHCVELTSTWHENKNSFLEQHVNNKKFNDVIMQFISNAFDSRKINSGKKYTNSNLFVQEMYDKLGNNIWYHFLQYVHESGKMKGINWIDFESEISLVIERIDKEQPNIHMPFQIAVTENDAKMTNFSNMAALFLKKFIADKGMSEKYSASYYDFIEKSYLDLRNLVRCLEIYLTECVDKIPITKISPDINGIDVQAVLNFNYTHTYANNYLSNVPIHYLHGRTNNPTGSDNNMVLGIDEYHSEYDRNIYTNYNIYKKFTQRILNETGFMYRDWLKLNDDNYQRFKSKIADYHNNLYIFGHSLDITDKDVLKDLICRPYTQTTIFYHNKQQQTQQIANLVKMLGQNTFIDMINDVPQKISFVQQQPMQNII